MSAALALLAAHALADFPLQSDRMAEEKLESRSVRGEHCAVHALMTYFFLLPFVDFWTASAASSVVFSVHFVIDSRRWSVSWAEPPPDWLPIANDQALHLGSLWLVAAVVL